MELIPSPPKPVIIRTGDFLTTGQAPNYQWYFNGRPLRGDTIQFHQATRTGVYQVSVTNQYGCTRYSDELLVSVLGVQHAELPPSPSITVYPDPAHGTATLRIHLPRPTTGSIWLVDVLGQATRVGILRGEGTREITQDMSAHVSGTYHVVVLTAREIQTTKFMKR